MDRRNETSPEGVQREMGDLESSTSTACPLRRQRMMYLRQPGEATGLSLAHSLGHT